MIPEVDLLLLLRASLAAALGLVIGWERESCGTPAGDGTIALLGLASAVFTALAPGIVSNQADRIVAGIVTGVGFLGAGVVMRHGTGEVRGLTTAASVWTVAGVGVVIGTGRYLQGVLLAALILLILIWEALPIVSGIGHRKKRAPGEELSRP